MSILPTMCFKFVISLKLLAHTHITHHQSVPYNYTILCNGPEHTLKDIIVDNDIYEEDTDNRNSHSLRMHGIDKIEHSRNT